MLLDVNFMVLNYYHICLPLYFYKVIERYTKMYCDGNTIVFWNITYYWNFIYIYIHTYIHTVDYHKTAMVYIHAWFFFYVYIDIYFLVIRRTMLLLWYISIKNIIKVFFFFFFITMYHGFVVWHYFCHVLWKVHGILASNHRAPCWSTI